MNNVTTTPKPVNGTEDDLFAPISSYSYESHSSDQESASMEDLFKSPKNSSTISNQTEDQHSLETKQMRPISLASTNSLIISQCLEAMAKNVTRLMKTQVRIEMTQGAHIIPKYTSTCIT